MCDFNALLRQLFLCRWSVAHSESPRRQLFFCACLPACLSACLPACLPACLRMQLSTLTYSRMVLREAKAEREQKDAEEMKQYEAGRHPASIVLSSSQRSTRERFVTVVSRRSPRSEGPQQVRDAPPQENARTSRHGPQRASQQMLFHVMSFCARGVGLPPEKKTVTKGQLLASTLSFRESPDLRA